MRLRAQLFCFTWSGSHFDLPANFQKSASLSFLFQVMAARGKQNQETQDKLTRIAIVSTDRCKPKRCRQECKKSCPVVRMGTFNFYSFFSSILKLCFIF